MVFLMKDFVLLKPFAIGVGQAEPEALGHSDINPETLGVGARLHGVESQFCQSLAAWP